MSIRSLASERCPMKVPRFGARSVFFVRDTPRAMEFYTSVLGFQLDWTHEEQGRPHVVQVSLMGLEIILNQSEGDELSRPGHGRLFVGLGDAQTSAFLQHIRSRGISTAYTHWGAPTLVIFDLDRNELFFWLSDAEREKWQAKHSQTAVNGQVAPSPSVARIVALRERPEHCAFFARAFEEEWPSWYGPGGPGDAHADLLAFANQPGELPVGVIALSPEGKPLGIAALKVTSIPGFDHLTPWATAGYVVPDRRRQGIGAMLIDALLVEASRLGYSSCYCATGTSASLLIRQGWSQIDAVVHDGQTLQVFRRAIGVVS